MAHFLLFPALAVAFFALRGWPLEWGAWARALLALGSVGAALLALAWLTPSSPAPRFQNVRKPGALDRIARFTAIGLILSVFYFLCVLGPAATQQLSYLLVRTGEVRLNASDDGEEQLDFGDSGQIGAFGERVVHTRVGTVFHPEGAPVPDAANLAPSDKPEVRLQPHTIQEGRQLYHSGAIYVTAFSHNTFDGQLWTSQTPAGSRILAQNDDGFIHLRDVPSMYRYNILHGRRFEGMNTVNTLQGVNYIRLAAITQIAPGTYLLPFQDRSVSFYDYEAGSTPLRFESLVARDLPIEPGVAALIYLAPTPHAGLNAQIRRFSGRFDPNLSLSQRLAELQAWLRDSYAYSLTVNYPNNGKCALENFLDPANGSGGFCVHFATAAALFAREIGVPSRICYGWSGGQFYVEHNQFVFRGAHAHTWAEILLEQHGWVVFEATPTTAVPQARTAAPFEAPPAADAFLLENSDELGSGARAALPFHWAWALAVCGSGLGVLFLLLLLKRARVSRSSSKGYSANQAPTPAYLKLFEQACMRLGHPMPIGRTLWQQLKSLEQREISVQFADDLLAYHYDTTYRNMPRDAGTENALRKQIKAW